MSGKESIYGLSQMSHIPESTLKYWKKRMTIDNNWRPWQYNHGVSHRIFNNEEESAIKEFIVTNFLSQGFYFNDEDFADIAFQAYLEKSQNDQSFQKDFLISRGFISDFKKRNGISSRRPHARRRPQISDEEKNQFVKKIQDLLATVDHSRVVNADETSWKSFPGGILTWSETGSDNVKIFFNGDSKQSITVMAGIKADGTKLPLFIIAKGTSDRAEKNLGDISYHMSSRSKNGWTTETTFKDYLEFLRKHFNDNEKIYLIVDLYKAHHTQQILEYANQLNIDLIFIPAGLTDELQPLDRLVFGSLKATARRLFKKAYNENPNKKFDKEAAIQHLLAAWEHLQEYTIAESWSIYNE